jgi:hypothetical protein
LSLPVAITQAQEDDQPLDDKFVAALVAMAINHDMMAGKDEIRDLAALHGFVSDYYDNRIATAPDSTNTQWLNLQKKLLTSRLEEEIKIKRGIDILNNFLAVYTLGGVKDSQYAADEDVRLIVSGYKQDTDTYDPATDYFNVMNSLIMTDFEAQINLLLDIDIVDSHPSLTPTISESSSWTYFDIQRDGSPSIVGDNNGSSSADFWDQSDDSNTIDLETVLKPVRFVNNGFESVTVVVESYEPAEGYSRSTPSASTTVFPESTSSNYLELPLGTYSFCYYWQLDTDVNNDDYFDYHHRSTSAVTINNNSSDNPESATVVTLSPDSVVSNPNGKCGEEIVADPGNSTLTPEEAKNAGTHGYIITCEGDEACQGESEFITITNKFKDGAVTITADAEEMEYFTRVGPNQYNWLDDDGLVFTLTFTDYGFTYYWDPLEVILYYTLQD